MVPMPWMALVSLLCVLGASTVMFWALVRRWTHARLWVELADWAAQHQMKLRGRNHRAAVPAPLDGIVGAAQPVLLSLDGTTRTFVQFEAPTREDASGAVAPLATATATPVRPPQWHVLVRRLETQWPPTALRPQAPAGATGLVDRLRLTPFPTMAPPLRFIVYGSDPSSARRLARSSIMGLLPADLGLALHGGALLIDFSARPFDPIELSRLAALAEQLVAHLPAPIRAGTGAASAP